MGRVEGVGRRAVRVEWNCKLKHPFEYGMVVMHRYLGM